MLLFRNASQRVFDAVNLDPRLRNGLLAHYVGGGSGNTWIDCSGNGKHVSIITPTTILWKLGVENSRAGLAFPGGSSNYGTVPSISIPSGGKTVAFWIWSSNIGGMSSGPVFGASAGSVLWPGFNGGSLLYGSGGLSVFTHGLSSSRWHHVAITGDGTTATYYRDGVLVNTQIDYNSGTINTFGGYSGGASLLGTLDDVRLYSRMLSTAEIALLSRPSFSPIITPYQINGIRAVAATNNNFAFFRMF